MKNLFGSNGMISKLIRRRDPGNRDSLPVLQREWSAFMDFGPALVWQKNVTGRYVMVNRRFCETVGLSEMEIIGKTDHDIFPAEIADAYVRDDREIMDSGVPRYGIEERHRKPTGEIGWSRTDKIPVRGEKGELTGTLGFAVDITDRRLAVEALAASERKWRNILVNTPQIGISLDPRARIIFANRHFLELTGWDEKEVLGRNWFDLFIPEDIREEVRGVFELVMNRKDTLEFSNYENEILTRTGELRNIYWSNVIEKDIHGEVTEVTCLGIDVTAKRRSEEALRESEKRFRALAEMLPEAVFEADSEMKLTFVNRQAYAMFGYTKEDFKKGLNGFDMLVPEDRQRARENAVKRFRGDGVGVNEYRGLRKDGRTFPVLFHTSPILRKSEVAGLRGIIVDITERKIIEEQLRQAQKMESIGNLAGGIAHDFNNILFPVVGMSEMLLEDLPAGSISHENVRVILKAAKRGVDLVKQILTFSRQGEHKTMPVRIQQVLKEVLKLSRSTIPSNIPISNEIQGDCGPVMADPTQLHQIAMNLITNAYHAVEETGGEIGVRLRETELTVGRSAEVPLEPGKYAILGVSDTGSGIDPSVIHRIFEPYFTTKPQGKGTGLGLSVVYGIVRKYGGDIRVFSEPGHGALFEVFLPILHDDGISEAPGTAIVPETGTERILLVDDEEPIALLERMMLERLGYRVTAHTGSVEALNTFRSDPDGFDLVISDMTMPNMTGDKLAEALNAVKPGIPVIICTGFSEKMSPERAMASGVKGFLMKPVVKSDMARMVRKVIDQSKELPEDA